MQLQKYLNQSDHNTAFVICTHGSSLYPFLPPKDRDVSVPGRTAHSHRTNKQQSRKLDTGIGIWIPSDALQCATFCLRLQDCIHNSLGLNIKYFQTPLILKRNFGFQTAGSMIQQKNNMHKATHAILRSNSLTDEKTFCLMWNEWTKLYSSPLRAWKVRQQCCCCFILQESRVGHLYHSTQLKRICH